MKGNSKHNVCAAENQWQFWGKHTKVYSICGYVAEVAMWTQRLWMMDLNMKTSMSMWRMVERWQSGWRWRWNSVSPQMRQQCGLSNEACHWTWNESNANIGKSFWNIISMQFQMKFTMATPFSTLLRTHGWTSARKHKVFKSGLCWLRRVSCFMRVIILIECLSQLQLTHSPFLRSHWAAQCTYHPVCIS